MTPPEGNAADSVLSRVAQIAEIVASLAVVVTLLFLIAEVRQNTRITQAAAYEGRIDDLNQWRTLLVTKPDLAALYMAADEPDEAALGEFRLGAFLSIQWSIYENAYFANQRDLLGVSEWGRFETQICGRYEDDGVRWGSGDRPTRRLLTEEFARFVETSCG